MIGNWKDQRNSTQKLEALTATLGEQQGWHPQVWEWKGRHCEDVKDSARPVVTPSAPCWLLWRVHDNPRSWRLRPWHHLETWQRCWISGSTPGLPNPCPRVMHKHTEGWETAPQAFGTWGCRVTLYTTLVLSTCQLPCQVLHASIAFNPPIHAIRWALWSLIYRWGSGDLERLSEVTEQQEARAMNQHQPQSLLLPFQEVCHQHSQQTTP